MAKIDLKHLDYYQSSDYIKAVSKPKEGGRDKDLILIKGFDGNCNSHFNIYLDKSTAIKFAKTLRTEINKIED